MLQTSLLLMKSLNKTETPIFLSIVCSLFPKAIFLTFIIYIFIPLSSEKYKIWIHFFLIYINVFITRDENFYGIH